MKKIAKAIASLILFFVAIPLLAGVATTALWNNILTSACGFAAIGVWQGVGMFILGQILSGGFVLGCFFAFGSIHHIAGHPGRGLKRHWHDMTEEQRREFIEQRARFGFHHHNRKADDGEK